MSIWYGGFLEELPSFVFITIANVCYCHLMKIYDLPLQDSYMKS